MFNKTPTIRYFFQQKPKTGSYHQWILRMGMIQTQGDNRVKNPLLTTRLKITQRRNLPADWLFGTSKKLSLSLYNLSRCLSQTYTAIQALNMILVPKFKSKWCNNFFLTPNLHTLIGAEHIYGAWSFDSELSGEQVDELPYSNKNDFTPFNHIYKGYASLQENK